MYVDHSGSEIMPTEGQEKIIHINGWNIATDFCEEDPGPLYTPNQ
jgi:hypothetical protein